RWDVVAALEAAERGAHHAAPGDQVARDDVERLALAGDTAHRRKSPADACGLDRLAHHGDAPGRLEGVVGAEAAGQLEHLLDDVRPAGEDVRRALPVRELEARTGQVDGDDPL